MSKAIEVIIYVIGLLVLLSLLIGGFFTWLYYSAKKEVDTTPRVPMLMCDKHGPYPADSALYINAPGTDTKFTICPICMYDRLRPHEVPQ